MNKLSNCSNGEKEIQPSISNKNSKKDQRPAQIRQLKSKSESKKSKEIKKFPLIQVSLFSKNLFPALLKMHLLMTLIFPISSNLNQNYNRKNFKWLLQKYLWKLLVLLEFKL